MKKRLSLILCVVCLLYTSAQEETTDPSAQKMYGNRRSKIYHCPEQAAYEEMKDSPNLGIFDSEAQSQAAGYRKAAR